MVDSPNLPARARGSRSPGPDLELRLRRAEVLANLGARVRFERPLNEVLRSLAADIVANTDAVAAGLILMNPADLSAIAFGTENLPEGYVEAMVRARQQSPEAMAELREAVASRQSWTLRNAREFMLSRPEYADMHDVINGLPYSTLVATPFLNRPETLGVVYLYYADAAGIDGGEIEFAQAIAQQAAPIMDNAWLLDETKRRSDELDALSRADQALHESLRPDDVYQSMINLAVDLFGADRSMFLTFDDAGRLHAFAARGVPEDELARLQEIYHRRDRSSFKGITAAPHIMEDVPNEPSISQDIRELTPSASTVDIRVFVRGEFFGVFVLGYHKRRTFDDHDRRLFSTLATRAGLAIQNALLFEEAQRRTDELEALYRADYALHQTLSLDGVLDAMTTLAVDLLGANSSLVVSWQEDDRLGVASSFGIPEEVLGPVAARYRTFTHEHFARQGPPFTAALIGDIRETSQLPPELRDGRPGSFAEIPVMVDGELWGLFTIGWNRVRTFNDADRRLFDAFAARAGLAIQNALVFEGSSRRSRELEALRRADEDLHRSLALDDVLGVMANLAIDLLGADSSLVTTWGDDDRLAVTVSRGISAEDLAIVEDGYRRFTRDAVEARSNEIETGVTENVHTDPRVDDRLRNRGLGAVVEIPVRVGGLIWGFFSIGWASPRRFSVAERTMFDAFAARAGLAIQNALLFEQAQRSASMEERQRIARELHDSVSQALYGIGLGARTARRRLGDGAANDVLEPIEYIVQLAESGLAETRALIFELVPESLEQQGLVLALERQAAAIRSRFRIDVSAILCDEPPLALRSKEALYRIAQESLHNIAKHAEATEVTLSLAADGTSATLLVRDNGKGFDVHGDFPGHLGLRTMRERTEKLGGRYEIESELGAGTAVTVTVPLSE
ncbi:MAG: GAF domain-containing protein [Dehalococcoidia bacterium]